MTQIAISQIKHKPDSMHIYSYLSRTSNANTAKELVALLGMDLETIKKRLVDLKKKGMVYVVDSIKGTEKYAKPEFVYRAVRGRLGY